MKDFARDGFTHEQVYDALRARDGSREVKFEYAVIRNGVEAGRLNVAEASVEFDRDRSIQRTARFVIEGDPAIDWLTDYIKPFMLVRTGEGWARFPLGVFVPSTPEISRRPSGVSATVEAYDRTVILEEDRFLDRYFIASGTKYIDAVKYLLADAGVGDVTAEDCPTRLPTDREFDVGGKKLEAVNALLSEINYEPVFADENGRFRLKKYTEPTSESVTLSYSADELSVTADDIDSEQDFYGVPNVFIAVLSNPELGDLKSVYTNSNPANKLSTVCRKRKIVSEVFRPDAVASQADLDEYVRRIAFEKSQVFDKITFRTANMPVHGYGEIVELRHPCADGVFAENKWRMELKAGGRMEHEAKRLVMI